MALLACESCKKVVSDPEELCPDGYCRACHKSLGFEECRSGEWADRLRAVHGLPPLPNRERRRAAEQERRRREGGGP